MAFTPVFVVVGCEVELFRDDDTPEDPVAATRVELATVCGTEVGWVDPVATGKGEADLPGINPLAPTPLLGGCWFVAAPGALLPPVATEAITRRIAPRGEARL